MKVFSTSLKREMKDCILAILWPRKDIYRLFVDCSVPRSVLKRVADWERTSISRPEMIDAVFDGLASLPDNGTVQFELLLTALSRWTHFDDYWFVQQNKLDIDVARKNIARLHEAKYRSIDKAKERVTQQNETRAQNEIRHQSLEDMRNDFNLVALGSTTAQARGYALETFLGKMARFFDLKVTSPFRIHGTQIDGTLKFDGENYTIEAKWEHQSLSDEPLLAFCHKQEMNMHGRGIFLSINGYTPGALSMLERSSIKNTVLLDGEDLVLVINELITLPDVLDAKVHAAQTRGQFYIHPVTRVSKILLPRV